ncbi:MAG: hypothetical protein COW21_00340 [Candidatus Aenigmarchaeota archaeon CG15_BIG_FIL_POST_REV_8_21_14_020_37_27]|nr:MAG: hypothetical protein COW21_00340 [Candidatus Aenigmarchaeota archaeon CG15_BIG_FIL_POST_REV_8_21_14_020_37_27]
MSIKLIMPDNGYTLFANAITHTGGKPGVMTLCYLPPDIETLTRWRAEQLDWYHNGELRLPGDNGADPTSMFSYDHRYTELMRIIPEKPVGYWCKVSADGSVIEEGQLKPI